jgi:hypothetical protein
VRGCNGAARGGLDGAPWHGALPEFHRRVVWRGAGEGDRFGRGNGHGNGSGALMGLLADQLRGSSPLGREINLDLKKINFYSIQNRN